MTSRWVQELTTRDEEQSISKITKNVWAKIPTARWCEQKAGIQSQMSRHRWELLLQHCSCNSSLRISVYRPDKFGITWQLTNQEAQDPHHLSPIETHHIQASDRTTLRRFPPLPSLNATYQGLGLRRRRTFRGNVVVAIRGGSQLDQLGEAQRMIGKCRMIWGSFWDVES